MWGPSNEYPPGNLIFLRIPAYAEDAHVPDGAFALYMAGQYNKRTAKKAAATRGACHGYLQFNKMVSALRGMYFESIELVLVVSQGNTH